MLCAPYTDIHLVIAYPPSESSTLFIGIGKAHRSPPTCSDMILINNSTIYCNNTGTETMEIAEKSKTLTKYTAIVMQLK